mmetsp:Transcript_6265/g.10391  ORF Transcript_6265/g.10391 Transcript_6265/m.10391 type:complete len:275 (+) Transcript_6265:87-911(+)
MAGRRLKRLIPGHFADLCESKNIKTVQDLIERPDLDIIDALDISVGDLASALRKVYATLAPKPRTAFNMLDAEMSSLTFESSKVRIEPGIITEVVGAAGVGKSQWCTTLSAMAYLPIEYGGLGGGVIYVDTESSFSPSRLVEIARSRYPKFYDVKALKKLTQSIHVFQCSHAHELVDQITQLDATIIEKQIKMIIVDSMASPFRSDFDSKHIPERQMMLSIAASKVLVIPQLTFVLLWHSPQDISITAQVLGRDLQNSYCGHESSVWGHEKGAC